MSLWGKWGSILFHWIHVSAKQAEGENDVVSLALVHKDEHTGQQAQGAQFK